MHSVYTSFMSSVFGKPNVAYEIDFVTVSSLAVSTRITSVKPRNCSLLEHETRLVSGRCFYQLFSSVVAFWGNYYLVKATDFTRC